MTKRKTYRRRKPSNPITAVNNVADSLWRGIVFGFAQSVGGHLAAILWRPPLMWWARPLSELKLEDVPVAHRNIRVADFAGVCIPPPRPYRGDLQEVFALAREALGAGGGTELEIDLWREYFTALEYQVGGDHGGGQS